MLERMWSKGNIPILLVGVQTSKTTLKTSMVVSQKIGNQPNSGNRNYTLGHIPEGISIILQRHLLNLFTVDILQPEEFVSQLCNLGNGGIQGFSFVMYVQLSLILFSF